MEGALLSSNRRQRSFGNLGKACTALHSPLPDPQTYPPALLHCLSSCHGP